MSFIIDDVIVIENREKSFSACVQWIQMDTFWTFIKFIYAMVEYMIVVWIVIKINILNIYAIFTEIFYLSFVGLFSLSSNLVYDHKSGERCLPRLVMMVTNERNVLSDLKLTRSWIKLSIRFRTDNPHFYNFKNRKRWRFSVETLIKNPLTKFGLYP